MPRDDLVRLRRGTTEQWEMANTILDEGEPGVDTSTGVIKVGDGFTHWLDLPDSGGPGGGGGSGPVDPDGILYHAEGNDIEWRIKASGPAGTPFVQGRYREGTNPNTEWQDAGPLTGLLDYTGLQAALAAQWDIEGVRWRFVPDGNNGAALYLQQNNVPDAEVYGEFYTVLGFHNDGTITGPDGQPVGGGGGGSADAQVVPGNHAMIYFAADYNGDRDVMVHRDGAVYGSGDSWADFDTRDDRVTVTEAGVYTITAEATLTVLTSEYNGVGLVVDSPVGYIDARDRPPGLPSSPHTIYRTSVSLTGRLDVGGWFRVRPLYNPLVDIPSEPIVIAVECRMTQVLRFPS